MEESGGRKTDVPVRRAPPLKSSFANLLLNIEGENEKVVLTIVHEKAGTAQLHTGSAQRNLYIATRSVGCIREAPSQPVVWKDTVR